MGSCFDIGAAETGLRAIQSNGSKLLHWFQPSAWRWQWSLGCSADGCLHGWRVEEARSEMMRKAIKTSISLDKSQDTMLVYCRTLTKHGVYDFLLGLEGETGAEPADAIGAIQNVLDRSCTVCVGRRDKGKAHSGPGDTLDSSLKQHFMDSIVTAVADGGPVEQKALFLCSPLPLPDPKGRVNEAEQSPTLFKNLKMISRDRPHRYRSVHRGFWANLPGNMTSVLDSLVTGNRSLCRFLEDSVKFQKIFWEKQQDAKHQHSAETFCGILRNFAYSEIRFDSRTRPLYRLFRLLPVVIDSLEALSTSGERSERTWASELLLSWGGDAGYNALVGAAVCADALVIGKPMLQAEDAAAADFAISGEQASQCLHTLKCMLLDGGLFLAEAEEALTHTCLRSISGRVVFLRKGTREASATVLTWPAPGSAERRQPIQVAKESWPQWNAPQTWQIQVWFGKPADHSVKYFTCAWARFPFFISFSRCFAIYEAFFKANFPFFEDCENWFVLHGPGGALVPKCRQHRRRPIAFCCSMWKRPSAPVTENNSCLPFVTASGWTASLHCGSFLEMANLQAPSRQKVLWDCFGICRKRCKRCSFLLFRLVTSGSVAPFACWRCCSSCQTSRQESSAFARKSTPPCLVPHLERTSPRAMSGNEGADWNLFVLSVRNWYHWSMVWCFEEIGKL